MFDKGIFEDEAIVVGLNLTDSMRNDTYISSEHGRRSRVTKYLRTEFDIMLHRRSFHIRYNTRRRRSAIDDIPSVFLRLIVHIESFIPLLLAVIVWL